MRTLNYLLNRKTLILTLISMSFFFLLSCNYNQEKRSTNTTKEAEKKGNVIDIITEHMDFQMPDTIPSGWVTFQYYNKSYETHLGLFDKYPEGKTIADGEKEVIPTFQKGMDLIIEGQSEAGFKALGELPEWFYNVVYMGGPGLVSPGQSTQFTVKLDPGYYVIECYVKMPNGKFHSVLGMAKAFVVSNKNSGASPPKPDVKLTISIAEGITYSDSIKKGKQTFSVFFKDQKVYSNFLGHDVNLVKLDENADLQYLEKWINWIAPKGLMTPAPEGITFLGGMNDLPAGETGYFTVDLAPGNYAFIAEVPDPSAKNMLKTFSVSQ